MPFDLLIRPRGIARPVLAHPRLARDDAPWQEGDHPRADNGQFGSGGGASTAPLNSAKWKRTGNSLGSNPGGKFTDENAKQWYSKIAKSADHARNEVLAGKLYKAAGSPAIEPRLVDVGGKGTTFGTATPWQDGAIGISKAKADQDAAGEHFATHAWLANWDAAGLKYDNQARLGGKMTTMDVGGALNYRAQGAAKGNAFGTKADEWDTLRNPAKNQQAASIFAKLTPAQLKASAARVAAIPDATIVALVNEHGPGDAAAKKALADKLIARRDDIAARAAKAGSGAQDSLPRILVRPRGIGRAIFPRGLALDAAWKESDHPRGQPGNAGQFGAGGASSKAKAGSAESLPSPPPAQGTAAKKIHAFTVAALNNGFEPKDIAAKIKDHAAGYAHPYLASYATKLLGHIEQAHSLKPGTLGKATPKGKGASPPAPPSAPKPAPAKAPAPVVLTPSSPPPPKASAGPEPHPTSIPQKDIHAAANAAGTTNAEKIDNIKTLMKSHMLPAGGFGETFGKQWITALGGEPDAPATTPSPPPSPTPQATAGIQAGKTRYDKGKKLEAAAKQVSSTSTKEAAAIAPSLQPAYWKDVSAETKLSFTLYAGSEYTPINTALRGEGSASASSIAHIERMDALFAQDAALTNEPVIIRRGEDTPSELLNQWKAALKQGWPPCVYTRTGYTSASMAPQPAFGHKPVWFHFVAPKGTRMVGVAGFVGHHENEILLQHGQSMEVYEIKEGPHGRTHVYATLL